MEVMDTILEAFAAETARVELDRRLTAREYEAARERIVDAAFDVASAIYGPGDDVRVMAFVSEGCHVG